MTAMYDSIISPDALSLLTFKPLTIIDTYFLSLQTALAQIEVFNDTVDNLVGLVERFNFYREFIAGNGLLNLLNVCSIYQQE